MSLSYWLTHSKHRYCTLVDFPKLNVHKKRWSINNPLFRKLLREHYVAHYVLDFKRLDRRIYYAYGMYHGVIIHDAVDMYRELRDRFYEIDKTLPEPPLAPSYCDTLDSFPDSDLVDDLREQRKRAHILHAKVKEIVSKKDRMKDTEKYKVFWEHMWRPLRSVNAELRNLHQKAWNCSEDTLEDHLCAVQGELDILQKDLRELSQDRRVMYNQYCPCKDCVRGLWHLRARSVYHW